MSAVLLRDLLFDTKDGDWGKGEPSAGLLPYSVIRATDFADVFLGDVSTVPMRYLSERTVARRTLQPNDILIETAGGSPGRPTGRTMLLTDRVMRNFDRPVTCASFSRFLRVDPALANPHYIYWYLQDLYNSGAIEQYQVQHTGVARFQYTDFASRRRIFLPPFSTQKSISEVLGSLDDKIASNSRIASKIDALLGAKLSEALSSEDVEVVTLGSIAMINCRAVKPTPNGSLRYIDIASVGVGQYGFPDLQPWEGAPSRARRGVSKGDTLWSTVRPNRRSHALNLSADSSLVGSTGLAVISPQRTGFAYLYEVTNLPDFTSFLEGAAEGSAYPAVRAERFADAPVPMLPDRAIHAFEEVAAPMRLLSHAVSEENRYLAQLRDVLLPQLMSGKLRVKDAEKQVEAVV